jgi:two-component system response regulator FixJ
MPGDRIVYVVDDDGMLRRSLERLLTAASFLTVPLASAYELLDAAPTLSQGCILLDLQLPEMNGLELQAKLHEMGIRLPVIMMTGRSDVQTAVQAMKGGAVDFIEKPCDDRRLIETLESAFARVMRTGPMRQVNDAARRIAALSRRERQVLDALISGESNKLIAHRLGISVRTVEMHRARMLERLDASSSAEAVALGTLARLRN